MSIVSVGVRSGMLKCFILGFMVVFEIVVVVVRLICGFVFLNFLMLV